MRTFILRTMTAAGVLAASAAPAAAQERSFEQQIEQSARAMAQQIQEHFEREAREFTMALQQGRPQQARQQGRGPQPRRGQRGPEETERFTRTVRLGANGTLDLMNLSGDVIVTGGGGTDVTIEAVKRTFGPRTNLQQVSIDVREQANRVEVRTAYPEDDDVNVSVDFTITLPQDATLFVRTVSGDIRTGNVRGELHLNTTSGDIQTAGARRIAMLRTTSGDVALTDVQSDGEINATSLSGDFIAQNVRARSLTLTSVSGDLRLNDVDSERVTVRTTSGDVSYSGTLQRNGRYDLNTHSGDVILSVSATGFNVEATTFNGNVRSDFPVTLAGNPRDGRRRGPGEAIRGSFGDGSAVLVLRSFNGDIALTRR